MKLGFCTGVLLFFFPLGLHFGACQDLGSREYDEELNDGNPQQNLLETKSMEELAPPLLEPDNDLRSLIHRAAAENASFRHWLQDCESERESLERLVEESQQQRRKKKSGGTLPWTCETDYGWFHLGPYHFPQMLRTASCPPRPCFNQLYTCGPRAHSFKVLKKLEDHEVPDPAQLPQLPQILRTTMKIITVETNVCCECQSLGRRG